MIKADTSAQAILKRHWMRLEADLMHRGIKVHESEENRQKRQYIA